MAWTIDKNLVLKASQAAHIHSQTVKKKIKHGAYEEELQPSPGAVKAEFPQLIKEGFLPRRGASGRTYDPLPTLTLTLRFSPGYKV